MSELKRSDTSNFVSLESQLELSPYDPSFPIILLSNGLNAGINEAENTAREVYNSIVKEAPASAHLVEIVRQPKLIVDVSQETLRKIRSGEIKLTTTKNGKTFAQILQKNGEFGEHLPVKFEGILSGVNPVTMAMAMQMKAMQNQLEAIANQINQIDRNVKSVIYGQQNDRIAQYYSGAALYSESREIENKDLRAALTSQSLKAVSDASFQLRLNMQSDIKYLLNEEYKYEKRKRIEKIDEKMNSIHQGFAYIHQSALLKAGIYCHEREYGAMFIVLDEYSYFIDKNIAANSNFLAQCDVSDDGTNRGVWESRAKLKLDTKEMKKQLFVDDKVLYLSSGGI